MRLRRLCLDRFGHFTGRGFDFGPAGDGPDFHIIHGPNEAGKTTAMEGALRLFYGFPHRESYDFKHQRKNLRVSALVEIEGTPRHFTRLPLRSGALADETGTALPEAALAAHLGGLGEGDYRNLLCLDDDTIERGGEEIAQARGDIGRLLFSAAAGVADPNTALDAVRDEATAIWRKSASKTRAARDRLQARAATLDAERRALPQIAEIDALAARIAPFKAYPDRLDFDPESLVALVAEESRARSDIARLTDEIATMTAGRDALDRVPDLPALAERLDALDDLRSRDATAGLDLARRRDLVTEADAKMARAARDLGAEAGRDSGELVLSPADIARLDTSREALRDREAIADTEARELADLSRRHESARAEYEKTATAPGAGGITALLARHDADRLAPAIARARQAIDAAEIAERAARAALSRDDIRFDRLPTCPMSVTEAGARAETHAENLRRVAQAEEAQAAHRAEIATKLEALGADVLINYSETDFGKEIWNVTNKRGVDVVVDSIGEATWQQSMRSLAKDGKIVTFGATSGPKPQIDIRLLFWRQLQIIGTTMGTRAEFEQVMNLVWAGKLKPVVDQTFPLQDVPKAQEMMENRGVFGKYIVVPE